MSRYAARLTLALATLAVATPAFAAELPFNCTSLEALVAEAPARFDKIKGALLSQENAADLAVKSGLPLAQVDRNYVRRVYATNTPMPGAKHCEVVDLSHGDANARVSQISHVCHYPDVSTLSAFNTQLAQCLGRPADPDADAYSLTIEIDTVASGEGYAETQVSATAQPLDGFRLSVVQTICENRRDGGCDDAQE